MYTLLYPLLNNLPFVNLEKKSFLKSNVSVDVVVVVVVDVVVLGELVVLVPGLLNQEKVAASKTLM